MLTIETLLIGGIPAITIIAVILEALKRILQDYNKEIPRRYLPLVSMGIGILLFVSSASGFDIRTLGISIMYGVLTGLTASGSYDVVKKTILNK